MTAPALHPTILVGCGAYGQRVLTSLLASAAAHGRLTWEDPPGAAGPSERRLRDLCLIWTPDGSPEDTAEPFGQSSDILKDLHRQITRVDPSEDLETQIVEVIAEAKAHLLDVRRRESAARLRLGLDVFVIARPGSLATLGALERLLKPAMALLGGDTSLLRSAQGGDLLNINLVLDFDDYWAATPAGVELRREVGLWLAQMGQAGPGFSRIYFSDRHTHDGSRNDEVRLAETALFLEFLLFEGLRADDSLRTLYQKERDDRAMQIGSFGIRLLEHSTGLLSRVAAAYFADKWLEYLAGNTPPPRGRGLELLRSWLDDYRPERLNEVVDEAQFLAIADRELATLEEALLAVPLETPDWPLRVRMEAEQGMGRLRRSLLEQAGRRARAVTEAKLGGFADRMKEIVTRTLHHESEPAPAGAVILELKELDRSLRRPLRIDAAATVQEEPTLVSGLDDIHRRYLRLRREQIDPARLRYWWPLLAATVAAGFTPFVMEAVHDIAPIDPALAFPLRWLLELMHAWVTPTVVVPLLAVAAWLTCRYGFERAVRGRIGRAAQYFTDGARGRLTDRVRWAIWNGPIRHAAHAHARQVYRQTALRVHHEVQTQTEHLINALARRVAETRWLRNQMREYLRSHGVDLVAAGHSPVLRIERDNLRHWIDLSEDLSVQLTHNLPTPDRFQSTQAALRPFTNWPELYADAFLRPVSFLDRLSQIYERPEERRLQSRDERAREELVASVVTLLRTRSADRFHPGFNWAAGGDAAGAPHRYAIVPGSWEGLPGLSTLLREHGWNQIQSASTIDRLFLLQVQFGRVPGLA